MGLSFTYSQENCGSITWNPADQVAQKHKSMTDLERQFHDGMVRSSLMSIAHALAGNMLMPEPGERAHLQDELRQKLAEFKAVALAYAEEMRKPER